VGAGQSFVLGNVHTAHPLPWRRKIASNFIGTGLTLAEEVFEGETKASAAKPTKTTVEAAAMVTPGIDQANAPPLPFPGQQAGGGRVNGHRSSSPASTATAVANGGGEQRMVGLPNFCVRCCRICSNSPRPVDCLGERACTMLSFCRAE